MHILLRSANWLPFNGYAILETFTKKQGVAQGDATSTRTGTSDSLANQSGVANFALSHCAATTRNQKPGWRNWQTQRTQNPFWCNAQSRMKMPAGTKDVYFQLRAYSTLCNKPHRPAYNPDPK